MINLNLTNNSSKHLASIFHTETGAKEKIEEIINGTRKFNIQKNSSRNHCLTSPIMTELQLSVPILPRIRGHLTLKQWKMFSQDVSDIRDANMERWLHRTKKFPDGRWSIQEKRTLWNLFNMIDADKSGEVDDDELADPLLSCGIAKNMAQVKALVHSVDEDKSGSIGFVEFLSIMRPKKNNNTNGKILGTGTSNNPIARLQKIQQKNGAMEIKSVLNFKRRKLLLDATMGESQRREEAFEKIGLVKIEAKDENLLSTSKCLKLNDIQGVVRKFSSSLEEKQQFVSAMKTMIARKLVEENN